jgi:putative OmpL-like beta-barrel porin-2
MGSFAKNVMWMGVFGLAGILSLSAPGRVLADDGGTPAPTAKDASSGATKSDSGGGAKSEKKPDAPAPLSERERMLLDRVEQLEKRVEELESKSGAGKKSDEVAETHSSAPAQASLKNEDSSSGDRADMERSHAGPAHDLAAGASAAKAGGAPTATPVATDAESTSTATVGSASTATGESTSVASAGTAEPAAAAAVGTQGPAKTAPSEPFSYADWTWLNGNARTKDVPLDTKFFTPEIRADIDYVYDFNHPKDDTIGGSSEVFRSDEVQVTQLGVGGDFHYDNVRARVMTQFGLYSQTTPRNDSSPSRGQWDLDNAYRYLSEAYGGYHFNWMHGVNVDAGIFMSYIGLFSYYNFDNWAYQPSYVSSNTPWFFNGVRVQVFPTAKLKIEPWFVNGWQSYGRFNGRPGFGMQILWRPVGWLSVLGNEYLLGEDALNTPGRVRYHSDDSIEIKYYDKPYNAISKMAFSLTGDIGCEHGGGVSCDTNSAKGPKQDFLGFMFYNRMWFDRDKLGLTLGGGKINNPGRYLVLLPPINGATAASGTPYFTENPGDPFKAWDASATFDYMPKQYITFRWEFDHRAANVPYFSGPGGITPTSCPSAPIVENICGSPGALVPGFTPDLKKIENRIDLAILVKF